jgi:hypothetical protein
MTRSAPVPANNKWSPVEDKPSRRNAAGTASTLATLAALRRHVAELCAVHTIVPIVGAPCQPRVRAGTREVALQYIGNAGGYWACLHDIGLAIADPAWGAFECELRAWSWACGVAVVSPGADVLDLAVAALLAELALGGTAVAPEEINPPATHLAD